MKTCLIAAMWVAMVGVANADALSDAAVAQARAQTADAAQVGDFYRGAGRKTDYQIVLEANRCYWFSATSSGLSKLYMYLWKPNASFWSPRVADLRSAGQGTMAYCTPVAGMYKFEVKTEGSGHFVVGLFAKEAPKQPVVAAKPALDLGPLCDRQAASSAPGAHRVGPFFEGQGNSSGHDDRFDYPIELHAGSCYWMVACGEPGHVKSMSLYLWDPSNKRVTDARGDSATPMIGHCATRTGMYKFETKITGGGGHFKAGVYEK